MHALSTATFASIACAICILGSPSAAYGDWNVGTDARWRHDNNVGNAEYASDIVGDSIIAAKLSVFQLFPADHGYSLTVAADLSGEDYDRLHGLSNASLGGTLALKKKWGVGAYAPWARIGLSVGHTDYDDDYRNASIYRTTLSVGRRIDERWNLTADYAYENRKAASQPEEVPGISGDAYSQTSHTLNAGGQYSWNENTHLTAGIFFRHGDVISTTSGNLQIFAASHALAEDPAFGPDAYAYRLTGSTYGIKIGVNYAPASHHLVGLSFARFDTHADGGNSYTKSVPEISWDYSF
jgi:hypothetical protein